MMHEAYPIAGFVGLGAICQSSLPLRSNMSAFLGLSCGFALVVRTRKPLGVSSTQNGAFPDFTTARDGKMTASIESGRIPISVPTRTSAHILTSGDPICLYCGNVDSSAPVVT